MKKAGIILGILCLAAIIGGWKYTEYKRSQIDLEGPVLTAADDKVRVPIGAPDSELIKGVTAWDEKDKDTHIPGLPSAAFRHFAAAEIFQESEPVPV